MVEVDLVVAVVVFVLGVVVGDGDGESVGVGIAVAVVDVADGVDAGGSEDGDGVVDASVQLPQQLLQQQHRVLEDAISGC